MKRARLGLGLQSTGVRAALFRGDTCIWSTSITTATEPEAVRQALRTVLSDAGLSRWIRPDVIVALGAAVARYRRIEGIQADVDSTAVTAAVAANADRFFLGDEHAVEVVIAHHTEHGWWAWAIEEAWAHMLLEECQRSRIRLRGMVPTVAIVGHVVRDGTVMVRDDRRQDRVTVTSGETTAVVPVRRLIEDAPEAERTEALFPADAAAEAAALVSLTAPTIWDPYGDRRAKRASFARIASMLTILIGALAVALGAPILRPIFTLWADDGALSPAQLTVAEETSLRLREHQSAVAAVESVRSFVSGRRSTVKLLGDLTAALPPGSAVVAVRIGMHGASLVVLTPPGESVLPSLTALDGIASARLVGAVTREEIQGHRVQRIAAELSFTELVDDVARGSSGGNQ